MPVLVHGASEAIRIYTFIVIIIIINISSSSSSSLPVLVHGPSEAMREMARKWLESCTSKMHQIKKTNKLRPVCLLRVWISEGLTQADSKLSGVEILMSVEFYRESPGKFDSRTLNRKTLSRWTGRKHVTKPKVK